MGDLNDFKEMVGSYDIAKLRACQHFLNSAIKTRLHDTSSQTVHHVGTSNLSAQPPVRNVNDFIEIYYDFIDATEHALICAELQSLGFNFKSKSEAVQNRFISSLPKQPYTWTSKNGDVVNYAFDLSRFPVFKAMAERLNLKFGCNMNSLLVSLYANGKVNVRLHQDGEKSLDPAEPICVLSLGATRRVEWVDVDKPSKHVADLALDPPDSALYIMKAGCQDGFLHRVRRDQRVKDYRISLSFRCSVPISQSEAATTESTKSKVPSTPDPPPMQNNNTAPVSSTPNLDNGQQGFSPFPDHSLTYGSSSRVIHNEKVCLLLGSSITKNVDGDLLSRKSRTVINLSESGAVISDLSKVANEFYLENPGIVHKVDRIVINIGTNDVKWLNGRKLSVSRKCRNPLYNLIRDLKFLFSNALIVFTTMLPIRALYNYTAGTVNAFNRLLFEVCNDLGCIFYDCFHDFLSPDYGDYNPSLFRDKWHLNNIGLRVLCRSIKFCIYGNIFSSLSRTSCSPSFYNFY